ncbi:MAG: 4-hydroxy-tetrahydrodipicolinate reductase, partial [Armatimonadota bacterium]|nr:4-hydroxy-tetrahydrodipicolinate reductase [Armatimonadota bacterium]
MDPITVLVRGAYGQMGREVVRAVTQAPDTRLVGAVDRVGVGEDAGKTAGLDALGVPIRPPEELEAVLAETQPRVAVDFTRGAEVRELFLAAIPRRVSPVVGATGIPSAVVEEAR